MSADNQVTQINPRNRKSSQEAIDDFFKSYPMYDSINLDPQLDSYKQANSILNEGYQFRSHSKESSHPEILLDNFTLANSQVIFSEKIEKCYSPQSQDHFNYEANQPSPTETIHINNIQSDETAIKPFKNSPLRVFHSRQISFDNDHSPFEIANNIPNDPETALKQLSNEIKKELFDLQFYSNPYLCSIHNTDLEANKKSNNGRINSNSSNSITNYIFDKSEISHFRENVSPVNAKIMKFLIDDLIQKEIDFRSIHNLLKKKSDHKKKPSCKVFLLFENINDMTRKTSLIYSQLNKNLDMLLNRDKFDSEFRKIFGQYHKGEFVNFLIFQESYIWCYIKIKLEFNIKKNRFNIMVKLKNPANGSLFEKLPDIKEMIDNLLENFRLLLKNGIMCMEQIKLDIASFEQNPCSIWNSGIEVYKKLFKDFTNFAFQKIDREYIYFILIEHFYRAKN